MAIVDHWPLFGLVVRTPSLELRYPDDDLAVQLAELAADGVHPADERPFLVHWTEEPTSAHLQHIWRSRAEWSPQRWSCKLVVRRDGQVVGTQDIEANDFARRRSVLSGSWLGQRHQGQGIGKEMRAAILHLAFAGLGAEEATTGAWHDNHASLGVTRSLGYLPNGEERADRDGRADRLLRFRLPREVWERSRRDDIEIEGLEPCRAMFGA